LKFDGQNQTEAKVEWSKRLFPFANSHALVKKIRRKFKWALMG
jgi:hypothetical protein